VAELRTKLLFTVGLVLLFRIGSQLPAPGVSYRNVHRCADLYGQHGLLAMLDLFSGGALLQLSVFALGVMPYITAAIVVQMLTPVVPKWNALKKDGPDGQAKLTQYTRYATLAFSVVQAGAMALMVRSTPSSLFPACGYPLMKQTSWPHTLILAATFVVGAMVVMWIGENSTQRGIGNGSSLLIMSTIAARLPVQARTMVRQHGLGVALVAGGSLVALVAVIVLVEQAQRRVRVTYPQKLTGDLPADAPGTYLPLKINQANVIPVIFASTLLQVPDLIVKFTHNSNGALAHFAAHYLTGGAHPVYMTLYTVLTVLLTFFYVTLTYDTADVADEMRKAGGFIPGVKPGEDTERHIDSILARLTTAGSLYLAVIAIVPLVLLAMSGGAAQLPLGGTSLLILVGVGLQTVKQLDAQLMQHSYPDLLVLPTPDLEQPTTDTAGHSVPATSKECYA